MLIHTVATARVAPTNILDFKLTVKFIKISKHALA
jgi:hypothetical protein